MSATVDELRAISGADHSRGCEGRQYACSCGYDHRVETALTEAADTIADLQAIANSHSLSLTAELERRRAAEAQLEALRVALAQIEAVAKDRSEKAWFRLDTIADIAHYAARTLSTGGAG